MKLPSESSDESEPPVSPIYRHTINDHNRSIDYSEYMWMEEEMEEFDRECFEQLLEDEFIEMCFEEMLEEEDELYSFIAWVLEHHTDRDEIMKHIHEYTRDNDIEIELLQDPTSLIKLTSHQLNPDAPEFVPQPQCPLSPDADR